MEGLIFGILRYVHLNGCLSAFLPYYRTHDKLSCTNPSESITEVSRRLCKPGDPVKRVEP